MNTTTFVFEPLGHTQAPSRRVALWTFFISFAPRMYARARQAGYFKPVRVVIRIRRANRGRDVEPYENPEFV